MKYDLDPRVVDVLLRERLDVAGALPGGDPAVEQLHDVGALARRGGGGDALLVRVVGEGLLDHDDVGVLGVELLDELRPSPGCGC
jgi:hypothetical protein